MARAVYRTELQKVVNGVLTPAANATCTVYEAGTTTPLAATMYAGFTGGTTLSNPLTADADGTIQFFLDNPQAVKLVATATGLGTVTADYQLVLVDQAADNDRLVTNSINAMVADSTSTTSLLTVTRDGNVDASLLVLTQSNGSGGVTSAKPALSVKRYTDGGGSGIFGAAYGSDGTGGSIVGGEFLGQAGTDWATGSDGLVIGVKADANLYRSSAKAYGANFFAWAVDSSATDATLVGIEVDLGGRTGSTVALRYGVQVVSPDLATVQASGEDVGFRLAAKSLGALFKTGILIDSNGGKWCMDPAGTLFDARTGGGAAKGVDFSTVTFTNSAFLSPGFMVSPVGRVGIKVAGVSGIAPLRMDAGSGDTANFVIDNAVIAGSAGSDTGTYMTVVLSGTTYKLKLFANA